MNTDERFEKSIIREGECWIWKPMSMSFWDGERNVLATRWIYERENGTIPSMLRNTCGNPRCVAPNHHADPDDLFWKRLEKRASGCWEWTGPRSQNGYGMVGRKKQRLAHRFAWELMNGRPPNGLFVLHQCDNRLCCNPDHLFLGTASDNMRDMHAKGRANPPRGIRNASAKMTDGKVIELHRRASEGKNIPQLAREFGISSTAAYLILSGINWRQLDLPVLKHQAIGERHGHAKLTDEKVREIHRRIILGERSSNIAREYHVGAVTICNIMAGRIWKHLGLAPASPGYKNNGRKKRETRQDHFPVASSIGT